MRYGVWAISSQKSEIRNQKTGGSMLNRLPLPSFTQACGLCRRRIRYLRPARPIDTSTGRRPVSKSGCTKKACKADIVPTNWINLMFTTLYTISSTCFPLSSKNSFHHHVVLCRPYRPPSNTVLDTGLRPVLVSIGLSGRWGRHAWSHYRLAEFMAGTPTPPKRG